MQVNKSCVGSDAVMYSVVNMSSQGLSLQLEENLKNA